VSDAVDRFAEVGTAAALEAGRLLMSRFRTELDVRRKSSRINLVTEMDVAAERLIVGRLLGAFPDHVVLAEEDHADAARGEHTWIVDPLDGTTNYAHGFPVWAVSIGLEVGGRLAWGAVYNPNLDELFTARRGAGARLSIRGAVATELAVSRVDALGDSLVATGFPYDIRTTEQNNLAHFARIALSAQAVRRAGSAALDLAWVAAGRFDAFWELRLKPWDCAAGVLLVTEAGGRVTDLRGGPCSIYEGDVVASNGLVHDEVLSVLAP
jgi:myo-inositol-1(or 4)-monophosphatase